MDGQQSSQTDVGMCMKQCLLSTQASSLLGLEEAGPHPTTPTLGQSLCLFCSIPNFFSSWDGPTVEGGIEQEEVEFSHLPTSLTQSWTCGSFA